jgi:thiamine-phosphate pyrophosphorylase
MARKLLGKNKIIGCSTHSLEQALQAQAEGADYIGVGPIFSTPTKPDYKAVGLDLIRQINGKVKIPFVAIGGIDTTNISAVLSAGAKIIAVVRASVGQKDIVGATRNLKNTILKYKEQYDLIGIS